MTKKIHTFKLLSKTTLIYLIFTFVAFSISAVFLLLDTNEFINEVLEHRFGASERRVKRDIKTGKALNRHKSSSKVFLLAEKPENIDEYPVYSDTLIYNSEQQEKQRYHKKVTINEIDGNYYKLIIIKGMEDFYQLRDDIFRALIPAFILLAVVIVLFNYLQSGYFFQPFNRILEQMKTFKVGKKSLIKKVKTNTHEFIKMQQLFEQMVTRIEDDYRNLKEYTENMAHEMQTPLTVILNKIENLIADDLVMQQQADSVKVIYDETNLLSKLGNTLNLLTKIENREFNNAVQIVTSPIIEKHVSAIYELAQLKSLSIDTELSDQHRLLIDPFLLDLVLLNLLRNAIRYGTTAGPITVRTTPNCLSVSNYGTTLEVPFEKLFERFYRINNTKASLGLGLSLIKKICELNQLSIDYKYTDGQHVISLVQS